MLDIKTTNLLDKVMFTTTNLSANEKLALMYVIRFWELKRTTKITNTPLSKFTRLIRVSHPTTISAMTRLEELGLITKRQNAFRLCNDYTPNIEAIMNLKTYNPITMKEE